MVCLFGLGNYYGCVMMMMITANERTRSKLILSDIYVRYTRQSLGNSECVARVIRNEKEFGNKGRKSVIDVT